MATQTRDRMIEAAVEALRHHGVAGMSFTEVIEASGAARGAIYHHFPRGKNQLVGEAAERNAQQVRDRFANLAAGTALEVVEAFLDAVRPVVRESAAGSGCAVAAVALAADGDDTLRAAAAHGFASWGDALTERLTVTGLPEAEARDLAATLLALLEGAHVLCRAERSSEPFERVARTALRLVAAGQPRR
jgi:AcrR family transcriptional regulator